MTEKVDLYFPLLNAFLTHCQDIRWNGSAALDLCYAANGRLDGFWEKGLHAWDTTAASLIIA